MTYFRAGVTRALPTDTLCLQQLITGEVGYVKGGGGGASDAGTFGQPWPGLGAYDVSKAALERLV